MNWMDLLLESVIFAAGILELWQFIKKCKNGWSFEGYIPIETRETGDIETMSLIFQREE